MRRILIYISVFVFVVIIAIVGFYYLNLARYTERVESSKQALELSMVLLSEKLSYGYFQWSEFYKAIQKGDKEFIENNINDMLASSPLIHSMKIIDRPAFFSNEESLYKILPGSKGKELSVYFNIFDDFLKNVVKNKIVQAEISLNELLAAYNMSDLIEIVHSEAGKPLVFGLNYKLKIFPLRFFQIVSALSIGFLACLIVRTIVEWEISTHYQTVGLETLVFLFEQRDRHTANHSKNVAAIAVILGRNLGIKRKRLKLLERAALLHDIGKIGIPEKDLAKNGKLNDEEYFIMKRHSEIGAVLVGKIPYLRDLKSVILYHHEKTDGSGYPYGLKGDKIPYLARILAVADVFDALISDRPYRSAMNLENAIKEMEKMPLDQEIVNALKNNIKNILVVLNKNTEMLIRQ
ncbi:MAG: HD-GYP domain-containing protein [Thermotogae bacterium]|nr:MAG: HD-GYP domain-containing protein [Thermotogota bacterium]